MGSKSNVDSFWGSYFNFNNHRDTRGNGGNKMKKTIWQMFKEAKISKEYWDNIKDPSKKKQGRK